MSPESSTKQEGFIITHLKNRELATTTNMGKRKRGKNKNHHRPY